MDYEVLKNPDNDGFKGSLWLLADSYYKGTETLIDKNGIEKRNNYLCILLYRKMKDTGYPFARWRRISIKTQKPDTEFNKFMTAISGKPLLTEKGQFLPFGKLCEMIKSDIKQNDYNLIIQFSQPYGTLQSCKRVGTPIIHRDDFKDLSWPKSTERFYPELTKIINAKQKFGGIREIKEDVLP